MLLELEKKVADFAKIHRLFDSTDRILLAVSGGADSIALMYVMWALKSAGIFSAELLCAHINHQLRQGEADRDEDFVVAQATRLNFPAITRRIDVRSFACANKLSIETAARQLRIESLLDIARHNSCASIATGHQKNDNAETVLQRLARGTGFRGLCGIWPERVFERNINFVRPLLCVTRDQAVAYLQQRNLDWCTDRTNVDCTYKRNCLRHRLLPVLQRDCAGSIVEQLAELAEAACRFHSMVCQRANQVWQEIADTTEDRVVLRLKSFLPEHPAIKVEVIRCSLAAIGSGEKNLTHRHYERICQLVDQNNSGKRIELPGGFLVRREYARLIFSRSETGREFRISNPWALLRTGLELRNSAEGGGVTLEIPGRTRFDGYLIEANILKGGLPILDARTKAKSRIENRESGIRFVERFDLDKVKLPLVVRVRQNGDRFWPLGLSGPKKVGKFMTAARVPQDIRQKVLIVADREEIIWVWPIRISEQAKVTAQTRKILQLQMSVYPLPVRQAQGRRHGDG